MSRGKNNGGPDVDVEEWLRFFSSLTSVPEPLLARAFAQELSDGGDPDAPLEVPDRIEITYKYSYGGESRFFRALRDEARLLAARCAHCGFVWCPPRRHCSHCYAETEWTELSGYGTVAGYAVVYAGTSEHVGKVPFVCAYVKLDGADTYMWQMVDAQDPSVVRSGIRVRARFREHRHGLMSDFIFVPVEEASRG